MEDIQCHTICSGNLKEFDEAVTEILNDYVMDFWTYTIQFIQDESEFYAHIIFTRIEVED